MVSPRELLKRIAHLSATSSRSVVSCTKSEICSDTPTSVRGTRISARRSRDFASQWRGSMPRVAKPWQSRTRWSNGLLPREKRRNHRKTNYT